MSLAWVKESTPEIAEIHAVLWLLKVRISNLTDGSSIGVFMCWIVFFFLTPSLAFPKHEAPAVLSHLQGLALPSSSRSSIPKSRVEIPLERVILQTHPWQSLFPRAQCQPCPQARGMVRAEADVGLFCCQTLSLHFCTLLPSSF